MYGYLLGFLFSTVVAVAAVYLIFVMLLSMGLSRSNNVLPVLLVLAGYLLTTYILAVFAQRTFSSNQWLAFTLNVSSIVFVVSAVYLVNQVGDFVRDRKQAHNAQIAIAEAPYIHLGEPFVNKVQKPTGGVVLFVHVPFTVTRAVQARSLMVLAPLQIGRDIKFSSNPVCNGGYGDPPYGFHLVDREYFESPMPPHVTGREIVSPELEPNRRYFLLRELHFTHSACGISDYDDFDVRQLNITLDSSRASRAF